MRRPAALTVAALFLLTSLTFLNGQTGQTPQSSSSEKSADTEKSQSSEKAQSSTSKPESAPKQQNPFDQFQQFSATVSGGPLRWDKMKIYRSGNKMRAEYDYEKEVRISDLGKSRATFIRHWVGKPEKCGSLDKLDAGTYPFFAYTGKDFKVERVPQTESTEKETIDGHPAKVENYTVTKTDGVLVAKVKMWEAEDLKGFPIRMEIDPPAAKLFSLYYSNVSLDRPDPKLFQVPPMCLKAAGRATETMPDSKKPTTPKASDKSATKPQ